MKKGIILAGGSGSRLYPVTYALSKQLLPVYDKPMIYYPLSILMLAGIQEILIIATLEDRPRFQKLFGDGSHLGLTIHYAVQESPRGIAEAFLIGETFVGKDPFALILGDNLFYGHDFVRVLEQSAKLTEGGLIFGYQVKDPKRYGIVAFDQKMNVISIEEKPEEPQSSYAVPGLYFYGPEVISLAKTLTPSKRGELEITHIHQKLLEKKQLKVELLGRGYAWLDTGTFDSLQKASQFVQVIQERQGIKIACIEEIACRKGFIGVDALLTLAKPLASSEYGKYLYQIAKELS